MSIKLISAILRAPWHIEPEFVQAHAPLIAQFIQRGYVPIPGKLQEEQNKKPYLITNPAIAALRADGNNSLYLDDDYDGAPDGSIAVIPVKGVLLKEDQDDGCGYFVAGTQTLAARIRQADENPNITGIILNIDSPGGMADGTLALADAIRNTKKPTVAFVDGMAASAAYWAASAADYIILENETISAGSIGTMISITDTRPYFEALGVKFHDIMSSLSPDKNADYFNALKGEYDPIKKHLLDPLTVQFRKSVKTARPDADDSTLTGAMYFAADAIRLKLADEIGPVSLAISKIYELAGHHDKPVKSDIKQKQVKMKNYPLLFAFLAIEALENTDEGSYLNEDQLTAIEQRLAEVATLEENNAAMGSAHTSAVDNLNTQLTEAQSQISALQQQLAERDTTIQQLTKGPAAEPAAAVTQGDASADSLDQMNAEFKEMATVDAIQKLRASGFNY